MRGGERVMGVHKEKTFRVQYPYAQAVDIARAALMGIGAAIQQIDPSSGSIRAMTGTTLQSYAEIIGVQVRAAGTNQSDIHIESASSVPTTMFDWGKNQENINAVETMFAQIAAQMQAAGSSAIVSSSDDDNLFADLYEAEEPTSPMYGLGEVTPPVRPAGAQIHKVFVSYRRSDSIDICGRIYDRLVRDFGEKNVFKDVDNIPFGVDFVDYLDNQVKECTVLLAVIGPKWVDATDDKQRRRLDDPNDFVRIEIESALKRNILVVPVLVGSAGMPYSDDLPESLRPLTRRNGIEVRPDPDFHNDMTRLIKRLG
jgi:hypothetical protein